MHASIIFIMVSALRQNFNDDQLTKSKPTFAGSAFSLVCVKILLWNGTCYDISDSTVKYCLRLNEVPNEFISRQFSLFTVLIIGSKVKMKSL